MVFFYVIARFVFFVLSFSFVVPPSLNWSRLFVTSAEKQTEMRKQGRHTVFVWNMIDFE